MKEAFKITVWVIVAIMSSLSSCIREDNGDCSVAIEFIYDYNMDYKDRFNPEVSTVDAFVFDSHGKFLFSKHAAREQLEAGKYMPLGNLPADKYYIYAVGNLSRHFKVTDARGMDLQPGVSSVEDLRIALNRLEQTVDTQISHLWAGNAEKWLSPVDKSICKVSLMRYTNDFNISICMADGEDGPTGSCYTFGISTPEGAVYAYDDKPLVKENVTYLPWNLIAPAEPNIFNQGTINTVRLFYGDEHPYKFFVKCLNSDEHYWDYDLMEILQHTKPTNYPDLPMQEYLDRRCEWNIIIYIKQLPGGDNGAFTAVAVKVNGWIMWLYGIDV